MSRLRRGRGLTQAALAQTLEIELRHLQLIESGDSAPGFDLLVDLAVKLEVEVGALFAPTALERAGRGRPKKAP
ncbi:MAG: helix-turn-helix transcriptional regulator [Myxococcota bacterium]